MQIGGFQPLTLSDFPGHPAAAVFTRGCNFRCPYCHNPQLLSPAGPSYPADEILQYLARRRRVLSAVAVTGGEPTLQRGLPAFLAACRSLGCRIKLDTNGSRPDMVQLLIREGLIDYCAVDLKLPPRLYGQLGARDGSAVLETISVLGSSDVPFEVRTTVAPGLLPPLLEEMASACPPVSRYILQPCVDHAAQPPKVSPSLQELKILADSIRPRQPGVTVRGSAPPA